MSSRPSTSKEIDQYKEAFRKRERPPMLEVTTVDGDHVLIDRPTRIENPTCDTLPKCGAHKIAANECYECWPQLLRFLGESAWSYHLASESRTANGKDGAQ